MLDSTLILTVLEELVDYIEEEDDNVYDCSVFNLMTDFEHALKCIFDWIPKWDYEAYRRNEYTWRRFDRNQPVLHQDIMEGIMYILHGYFENTHMSLTFVQCRSHKNSTCNFNRLAHKLACDGVKK